MNSSSELTQLILDCTSGIITGIAPITRDVSCELITQRLVYDIHLTHRSMLALIAPMHRRPVPSKKKVANNNTLCYSSTATTDWIRCPIVVGGRPVQGRKVASWSNNIACMTCIWCENSAPHNQLWWDYQNKHAVSLLYPPLCSSLTPSGQISN